MSSTTELERNLKEMFVYFFVYEKLSGEFQFVFKKSKQNWRGSEVFF